ncbi:2-aminoethylphosphonate aminotransferase [Bacillus horti]|uniref:2-aminoethylphosphonate--pyruvate transaminase n=1 Tax=Caldalkalibacillus horti TaxID=77523 RepID=A0ABT9VZI5_9BACI|nr:2-aminoethylphosphonate--pyruvate transaminase [Bacillus horti]MDQ0166406.1 2-aminoethylphosphonate-pyruvate transaminase [Bacillus horti]
MKSITRNILLNPGPATTTDSVKLAQVVPDICPREAPFGHLMKSVSIELTNLVSDPEHYTTVLFGGSGTAAVEAILSSVVGQDTVLIVQNGAYGKRMCEIAQVYDLDVEEFKSPCDAPIDLHALETLIQLSPRKISHLAIVHHETTVGLLNDIQSIGDMCKSYNIDLIVDAMSSYGAVPIDMEKMNISYLAASSNKNLQGMAGISFVIADQSKLDSLKNNQPRNYYLNLYAQHDYFSKTQQMRFTPPVQTFYALKRAIEELREEGLEARYARYAKSWETLIQGISRLGLKHLVEAEHHSKLVTAILEPDCAAYSFKEMHDYFYSKGFTIYPGKWEQLNTFRIANIGDITYRDIEEFLRWMERYLQHINYIHREENSS